MTLLSAIACTALQSVAPLPRDALAPDFGRSAPASLFLAEEAPAALDEGRFALGRALFFDPILSRDRTLSCASCHQPAHGFADPLPISLGVGGASAVRHTPSLFNRGLGHSFSWTGVASTLEQQVLLPIPNEREMALGLDEAVARLSSDRERAARFEREFGRAPTSADLGAALAQFVGRIWIGDSAVDRFQAGDFAALDERERAGLWLYESKAGCWRCHSGRNYADEEFHATGVGARGGVALPGRAEVSGDARDRGRFKTPTLRGLALTAPYMHDGSLATLDDVVAYYRRGGNAIPERDPDLRPLELTDEEARNLVAFLRALSPR